MTSEPIDGMFLMHYILLVTLWVAWCILHSALISLTVTEALRKRFPEGSRYYRILFNCFAVASLIPVVLYGHSLRSEPIVAWEGFWLIIPVILAAVALFFFVAGARCYDFLQVIGLRQIKEEKICSVLTDDCSLETGGVLSLVRHPWYTGGILIVWARPLDTAAILTNMVICGYFVVGAILEERKLKVLFGRQYAEYQKKVSMFFPIKWARQFFLRNN